MRQRISLGISPCPNDTYIFHAMLHGLVPVSFDIDLHMADVEDLNARAVAGTLDVTKLSVGVVAEIMDKYAVLDSGAALGWGCGPLVVARTPMNAEAWRTARMAIPGRMTTANLLLEINGSFQGEREEMIFDQVIPAVVEGRVDCGVIIHEGRFTYAQYGLHALLDLGAWWEEAFKVPLPLGAIAARRDMDPALAQAVQKAIADSVNYAHAHPEAAKDFIRAHAQELSPDVTDAHIRTFVTDFSRSLGEQGRAAVRALVERAAGISGQGQGQGQGRKLPDAGLFL